jgi:hypothetical protein
VGAGAGTLDLDVKNLEKTRFMMKKTVVAIIMLLGLTAYAGQILLPQENLAVPQVAGSHLVVIWDETADDWHAEFASYDHSGSVTFQVPEWGRWYWVGLWDEQAEDYVFGKWIGHFPSE